MGKHANASCFKKKTSPNHQILSGTCHLSPPVMTQVQLIAKGHWKCHLRSYEVINNFLLITRDRMKLEMCNWCQSTRVIKTRRSICNMTLLGHDLTLTRGQLLKLTFWGHEAYALNASTRGTRWCQSHFSSLSSFQAISEKLLLLNTDLFPFDDLWWP